MRHGVVKGMLVLLALLVCAGCQRFFVRTDALQAVKRIAIVQHAVDPNGLRGATHLLEAKTRTAEANVKTFARMWTEGRYEVVPLDVVTAHPVYVSVSTPEVAGYYTAPGMRFVTGRQAVESTTLAPEMARTLATALDVDAVAVIYERWSLSTEVVGIRSRAFSTLVVTVYGRDGAPVWTDEAFGESEATLATPGGVVATELPALVLAFNQSCAAALDVMQRRLAAAR
ncbi:hypothetical protein DRW03_05015 [Corallococcus sp. H22C18031201]|uniref:hypothetical protein n=1 Tax=Citreicoccus inhibens TaxID=2849499 RepID=UPI000E7276F4|nr:hypothetical protein [Citreicoccus inhibens]MBU8895956.1 hypothetical protein [Citreicoccus inhibens]RJS25837.1 hypothetical protein DRW03_05015 [Corallococcus sp. H22C18031201]